MHPWRHMGRLPGLFRGRALVAGSAVILALLSYAAGCQAQQGQRPQAGGVVVPTLEALPHDPLPRGRFLEWCADKIVMEVGRGQEIYGGARKASPLTFPSGSTLNCGDDGQKLAFIDDDARHVSEVDVAGGIVMRTLATYEEQLFHPKISFAPDLKSVASDRPLTLLPGVVDLNAIQVKGGNVRHIQWNRDSSRFFVVSEPPEKNRPNLVEIFNAQNQKVASGTVRADFLFRDGWFAGSQALYLYFGSRNDEFGSGVVLKCRIENWRCDQIAQNVLYASAGGDGILGTVRAIGKYSNDGDTETYPPRYVADIRNGALQVVARQTFESADRTSLSLAVSPSGTKAILTWFGKAAPGCPPEKQEHHSCEDGIMIDLSGKPK